MSKQLTVSQQLQQRGNTRIIKEVNDKYGIDVGDSKIFDFESPFFSFKTFRNQAYKLARSMQESTAETTFGQLLRAGIQSIANGWYQRRETTYQKWVSESVSSKRQEFYAPLHHAGFPRRVDANSKFPEVTVAGLDIMMKNYKFGAIIGFERELFDDDQTGQVQQRSADMGENMAILEEIWAYARFIGLASSYAGDPIPASETKPANETAWPFSTSFVGGGANRPATYVRFGKDALIAAWKQLVVQKDLLGNIMSVRPDTILCSREDYFDVSLILNSQYYPSVPSTTTGATGAPFASNELKGIANVVMSPYLPDKAWAFGQAGRGFVFQRRDPLEIIQENPSSGMAFEQDEFRFRSRSRWDCDWVDPRFWFLGDDGTV